jgi:hypothetical protein
MQEPSDQDSGTCYAHATAAVIHMALARIVGREGGYPTIKEIRTRILERFPPISEKGQPTGQVLAEATLWYRPLRFREVDEEGARQAVLRRRPVLTTFQLSDSGWDKFDAYFKTKDTAKSVLTRRHMASNRSGQGYDGHAVVLIRCAPRCLTFLNSWGHNWGDNGSFSVEDHTVLQRDSQASSSPVYFYDVYWLESDLTETEQQAYSAKVDSALRARAGQNAGVLELEARCPRCHADPPIANFRGSIRRAECPLCQHLFAPQPGHLMQALYARAGLSDLPEL